MNWEAIGAIGEIIGALAVVVSIVFLIFELRRGRIAAETESFSSLADGLNNVNLRISENAELAEIWTRGLRDPDSLDETEYTRLLFVIQSFLNHFVEMNKRRENHNIPRTEWEAYAAAYAHAFNSPGGKRLLSDCVATESTRSLIKSLRDHELQHSGFIAVRTE